MFHFFFLFLFISPDEQGGKQGNRESWRSQGKAQVREVEEHEKQKRRETVPEGVCQTMCPARELRDRERQIRLHSFEMLAGTERDRLPRGDPSRAVKEYSRPAAGKDSTNPTDLRPPEVLLKTVCYLIDNIAASPHLHPWTEVSTIMLLLIIVVIVCSHCSLNYNGGLFGILYAPLMIRQHAC